MIAIPSHACWNPIGKRLRLLRRHVFARLCVPGYDEGGYGHHKERPFPDKGSTAAERRNGKIETDGGIRGVWCVVCYRGIGEVPKGSKVTAYELLDYGYNLLWIEML